MDNIGDRGTDRADLTCSNLVTFHRQLLGKQGAFFLAARQDFSFQPVVVNPSKWLYGCILKLYLEAVS